MEADAGGVHMIFTSVCGKCVQRGGGGDDEQVALLKDGKCDTCGVLSVLECTDGVTADLKRRQRARIYEPMGGDKLYAAGKWEERKDGDHPYTITTLLPNE